MKYSEVNINNLQLKDLILKLDRVSARLGRVQKDSDYVELIKNDVVTRYDNWKKASDATGIPLSTLFKVRHGEAAESASGLSGYAIPSKYILIKKEIKPKYKFEFNGIVEEFVTQMKAATHYNVSQSTIKKVIAGKECKGIKVVN